MTMNKSQRQFITREEVGRIINGTVEEATDIINEGLSRVYNKSVEDTLRRTPNLMLRLFVAQQAQNKLVSDFYENNPDFNGHRDIVQPIVQKVEADNPDKTFEFILSLAAPMIQNKISKLALLKELAQGKPKEISNDKTVTL